MARSRKQPQRSNLTPFYVILGIVVLVGAVFLLRPRGGGAMARQPVDVQLGPGEASQVQGISMGSADAPVVIYEFADFQCPGCGQFATFVAPLVKERLVDEGLARFVYYDFPLTSIHPNSFLASRAARCANEQGRFWEYHDLLYARQATWSPMGDPAGFFVDLAAGAGLDRGSFEECLRSDRYAEEVTRSMRMGESLGVNATPTIFVNMKRLPRVPQYSDLERMVREEAGEVPSEDS